MSAKSAMELVSSGLVVLLAFFAAALLLHSDATTPNPEVSLGIISGAALTIERSLEVAWSLVDMTKGSWWPLSVVGSQITTRVNTFNDFARPYFDGLKNAVDHIEGLSDQKETIKAKIDAAFQSLPTVDEVAHLTSDARLNQLATTAASKLNAILAEHPSLRQQIGSDIDYGADLMDHAQSFLTSFNDNPGRRILSLYVGSVIGIMVAGVVGLDVFGATNHHLGDWGIPLTGMVMGLGANPTHEIIAALKSYKQQPAS